MPHAIMIDFDKSQRFPDIITGDDCAAMGASIALGMKPEVVGQSGCAEGYLGENFQSLRREGVGLFPQTVKVELERLFDSLLAKIGGKRLCLLYAIKAGDNPLQILLAHPLEAE